MATRNAYLQYKWETSCLLYWLIQTSNNVIRSSKELDEGDPTEVETTGKITVATCVALAKFVAKHITTAPPTILSLFRSVIDARTSRYKAFQELVAGSPDPAIERSNKSHKHFIDALTEAFHALGGREWKDTGRSDSDIANDDGAAKVQLDRLVLENKFDALTLEDIDEDDESDEASHKHPMPAPRKPRQSKSGKGKKGRRAHKPGKRQGPAMKTEPMVDELTLDDYGLLLDDDGMYTEYSLAVFALLEDMVKYRVCAQRLWRESVYDGLNSAAAAAVSNLAVATIQRSSAAMFVSFPGRDTYQSVMAAFDASGFDNILQKAVFWNLEHHQHMRDGTPEVLTDIAEQCMTYANRDLIDFIEDFQKTRSGKPTKRMLGQIRDWDPNLNLQEATPEQRIRWRRVYTVRWLYDLVNVLSAPAVQQNASLGDNRIQALETVDWSPHAQWTRQRTLLGLGEFAGFVTSLAM